MKLGAKNYKKDFDKELEKRIRGYKYHLGWGTFIFICLCFILIMIISLYAIDPPLSIFNAFIVSTVICFCLNLFWWIDRQKLSLRFKWKTSGFYKWLKLDNLLYFSKERKEDYAFNHIESYEEYLIYYDQKIKNSKIAFCVSISFFSLALLCVIIASFFVK